MRPSPQHAAPVIRPSQPPTPTPNSPMVRSHTTFTRLMLNAQGNVAVTEEEGLGIIKVPLALSSSPPSYFRSSNEICEKKQPADLDTVYCDDESSLWEVSSSSSSSFSTISSSTSAGRNEESNVGNTAIRTQYLYEGI